MNLLLFILSLLAAWVALHFLIKTQVRQRVDEEFDRYQAQQGDIARRHSRAVHEVRDELRRTSHQLIATAIQNSKPGTIVSKDPDDPAGR